MTEVWLALGSNLADPLEQIHAALAALDRMVDSRRVITSSFYRTPPYGPTDQPDFLNVVTRIDTTLSAACLLRHTQRIEQQQGRIRAGERWGPRTLDIDILLYGNHTLSTPDLTVPHYDMHRRAFVLVPLAEVAPNLHLPDGRSIHQLLAKLDCRPITLW